MDDKHIFNKETDSEILAMDIVTFLRKWGMWQDVQIFTCGKCYTDDHGKLVVSNEEHPEIYLKGLSHYDCTGKAVWEDFSNPERLLDMTFEGPFSLLLRHHEYEVHINDVSGEVRDIIVSKADMYNEDEWDSEVFYDHGKIAGIIIQEFNNLLEKYGLWYDLCFSWSLTTYKI